jgi:hypothetical protein
VAEQMSSEQFCWKAVTGMMASFNGSRPGFKQLIISVDSGDSSVQFCVLPTPLSGNYVSSQAVGPASTGRRQQQL